MLNRIQIIGNVGGDPDIRFTQGGVKVINFSIATTEKYKDKNGLKAEKTQWHRVVVWNEHLIKIIEKYVRKGDKLYIAGKMTYRKWSDSNGIERLGAEIELRFNGEVELLGAKKENSQSQQAGSSENCPQTGTQPATPPHDPVTGEIHPGGDLDDEIPF